VVNGLYLEAAGSTPSCGAIICENRHLHLFGIEYALLGSVNKSEYVHFPISETKWDYFFDGSSPSIRVVATSDKQSWFEGDIVLSDLVPEQLKVLRDILPDFPRKHDLNNYEYELRIIRFRLSQQSMHFAPVEPDEDYNSMLGKSEDGYEIRSWTGGNVPQVYRLPKKHFLGQSEREGGFSLWWWNADASVFNSVGFQREDIKSPSGGKLIECDSRPVIASIQGTIRGKNIEESPSLIYLSGENIKFQTSKSKIYSCPVDVRAVVFEGKIVLLDVDRDVCLQVDSKQLSPKAIADRLGLSLDSTNIDQQVVGFVTYEDGKNRRSGPVSLNCEHRIESQIESFPLQLEFSQIKRANANIYVAESEGEKWTLRVDPRDDQRVRERVLHGSIIAQFSDDSPSIIGREIESHYDVLNGLRVNEFMFLLFKNLGEMHETMQLPPSPAELFNRLDGENTSKDDIESLIEKCLELSIMLPELSRKLEELGTEYPHQVSQMHAEWMGKVFGEKFGEKRQAKLSMMLVRKFRQHVRSIQGDLWRSLGKIERLLVRLEPVYGEHVKKARNKTQNRALIASGLTTAAATGAVFVNPLTAVFAGISVINLLNNISSQLIGDSHRTALLLELGPQVLKWWFTFEKTFYFYVYESNNYLNDAFKDLKKIHLNNWRKMEKQDKSEILERLPQLLREQIEQESQRRFEGMGENRIRQDMIETLEKLHGKGEELVNGCLRLNVIDGEA